MKILVTGGNGLLGGHLIPKLVEDGHQIFALTRSASFHDKLAALGASPVHADLESSARLSLPGIEAVAHAAPPCSAFRGRACPSFASTSTAPLHSSRPLRMPGRRPSSIFSTAGIVMDNAGTPIRNADESAPTFPNHFSAYLAKKARAEPLVLSADKPGFRTIALRPSAIWGPGDPFSRTLPQAVRSGRFAFIDSGDYAFATCHVDNVVEAIQCALERGKGARDFFIKAQEGQTFRDFVASLASLQGLSIDKLRSMSYWLASAVGRLLNAVWVVTRRRGDPPVSRSMIRMLGREFTVNDATARRELGYVGRTSRAAGLRSYGKPPARQ
jgi:nucleoside-diphosphate-sugar epimerase